MKKKYCIAFLALVLLGGVAVSIAGISKAKVETQPAQTKSAPSKKLERTLEKKEYQNGITIEGEVWSQEMNEASEEELKNEMEAQANGQAGTPAK